MKTTISSKKGVVIDSKGSGLVVDQETTFTTKAVFNEGMPVGRNVIQYSDLGGGAGFRRIELSGSSTGQTWVLGDVGRGAPYFVVIPSASVGWTGRFLATGSYTASSSPVLTCSLQPAQSARTGSQPINSATPIRGRITAMNDGTSLTLAAGIQLRDGQAGTSGAVATSGNANHITFAAGTAVAGDFCDVEVITAGLVVVTGESST